MVRVEGLQDRVAVVTGGGRGIGLSIVRSLVANGARVAALDLTPPDEPGVLGVEADVSDEQAVNAAFDTVERELGPVTVLVLNAGILPLVPLEETSPELWERTLAINLTGGFLARGVQHAGVLRIDGDVVDMLVLLDHAPLEVVERPVPEPGEAEILIRVTACGVCHTELDEIEGRTPPPSLPIVPGHQVIGRIERRGRSARAFKPGERVGVGWIYSACGACVYCRSGRENLCPDFRATGRDVDGGYAEFMTVPAAFAHHLPYRDPLGSQAISGVFECLAGVVHNWERTTVASSWQQPYVGR